MFPYLVPVPSTGQPWQYQETEGIYFKEETPFAVAPHIQRFETVLPPQFLF